MAGDFAQIPEMILIDPDLTKTDLRVYGIFALHRNSEGLAWCSAKTVAEYLNADLRGVRRSISRLLGKRYMIFRGTSAGRSTRYVLPLKTPLSGHTTTPPDIADPDSGHTTTPNDPDSGHTTPETVVEEPPKQTIKQIDNNKMEISEAGKVADQILAIIGIPDDERSTWNISLVCKWLELGADPAGVILPTVRAVVQRSTKTIHTFKYFDKSIIDAIARWETDRPETIDLEELIEIRKKREAKKREYKIRDQLTQLYAKQKNMERVSKAWTDEERAEVKDDIARLKSELEPTDNERQAQNG